MLSSHNEQSRSAQTTKRNCAVFDSAIFQFCFVKSETDTAEPQHVRALHVKEDSTLGVGFDNMMRATSSFLRREPRDTVVTMVAVGGDVGDDTAAVAQRTRAAESSSEDEGSPPTPQPTTPMFRDGFGGTSQSVEASPKKHKKHKHKHKKHKKHKKRKADTSPHGTSPRSMPTAAAADSTDDATQESAYRVSRSRPTSVRNPAVPILEDVTGTSERSERPPKGFRGTSGHPNSRSRTASPPTSTPTPNWAGMGLDEKSDPAKPQRHSWDSVRDTRSSRDRRALVMCMGVIIAVLGVALAVVSVLFISADCGTLRCTPCLCTARLRGCDCTVLCDVLCLGVQMEVEVETLKLERLRSGGCVQPPATVWAQALVRGGNVSR